MEKTKVARKINFSSPRLVKDAPPPEKLLDKPAVLDCTSIKSITATDKVI